MPSMIVSGAGTAAANGTYTETGTFDGKPYYNKSGTTYNVSSISWEAGFWTIKSSSAQAYYYSTDDVATPDLVTTWTAGFGATPVPTVTAGASGPVMPIFKHHYSQQGTM